MTRGNPHVTEPQRSIGIGTNMAIAVAVVLLVLSVWSRGLEGQPVSRPDVDPEVPPAIEEAAQFLSPGAYLRLKELDEALEAELQTTWQASSGAVFTLDGCPPLLDWMHGQAGLEFETTLRELRGGGEVEALAALTLIFQLARTAEWDPGFLSHTEHVEKLASLLEPWLLTWAERGIEDPLLFEPTTRAALLYGKTMHVAYDAPLVGRNESVLLRAKQSMSSLIGAPGARTKLGRALQEHHSRAIEILESEEACCRGFAEDCEALFPDLDGECEE